MIGMGPLLQLLALAVMGSSACYIQGHDSGVCVDPSVLKEKAPFCTKVVKYTSCVPKEYSWFPNHTLINKDAWVQETFESVKARRLQIEAGRVVPNLLDWEGGGPNTARRFTNNPECEQAYLNFLCFLNFPRCDTQQESMMLCQSVCLNYFRACRIPEDMVRCFSPENFGGKIAEASIVVDPETGLPILLRAPYPGQPFRENMFQGGKDLPVCTPALAGGAGAVGLATWAVAGLLAAILFQLAAHE